MRRQVRPKTEWRRLNEASDVTFVLGIRRRRLPGVSRRHQRPQVEQWIDSHSAGILNEIESNENGEADPLCGLFRRSRIDLPLARRILLLLSLRPFL